MLKKLQAGLGLFEVLLAMLIMSFLFILVARFSIANYQTAHAAYQQSRVLNTLECYLQFARKGVVISFQHCAELVGLPERSYQFNQRGNTVLLYWFSSLPLHYHCLIKPHQSCVKLLL